MKEFRKTFNRTTWRLKRVAFCTYFLSYFHSSHAFDAEGNQLLTALSAEELMSMQNETYTINFNNVSMLEFLRFASLRECDLSRV